MLGFAAGVDAAVGTPASLLVQLPLVLIGGVVLRALSRSAAGYDRALGREQALRRAGAALVAARDRDGILAAVPELAGAGSHATITIADGHRIVTKGEAVENPIRLSLCGHEPQGVLDVEAPAGVDVETRTVLETFAGELGMALEAAGRSTRLARRDADAWYHSLLDNAADVITVLEPDSTIRYQTPSIEDVLGYPPDALAGTKLLDVVHPDEHEWVLTLPADGTAVVRWRDRDGSYRWVESRYATCSTTRRSTASSSRARHHRARFAAGAAHPSRLPRRAHGARQPCAVRRSRRARPVHRQPQRPARRAVHRPGRLQEGQRLARPPAGDELLRACARRLTERLAAGDTAARLGGDEFAILVEDCPTPEAAGQMARYLLDALAEPLELDGRKISLSGCAGIALVTRREQPPAEEVLRSADIALDRAKDEGPRD